MLILVLGFELVSSSVSESGFSSGEVFVFERSGDEIKGEFLGHEFDFDISFASKGFYYLDNLALLLPPCSQLFLKLFVFAFLRL